MKQEVAEKWVAALRSGKYEQTTEKLRDIINTDPSEPKLTNSFCCLGVLCNLFAEEHTDAKWVIDSKNSCAYFDPGNDDGDPEALPVLVQKWADMDSPLGQLRHSTERDKITAELRELRQRPERIGEGCVSTLADANDHNVLFEKLADFIERNWRHL